MNIYIKTSIILVVMLFTINLNSKIIDGIAAIVNNDIILISDVKEEMKPYIEKIKQSNLPEEVKKQQIAKIRKDILETFINNKLIEQKAKEMHIQISDEEVDNVIKNILKKQGISLSELKETLKEHHISFEKYREKLRKEILRARVVNSFIKSQIKIPKEDIEKYIKEHFSSQEKPEYHIKQIFFKKADYNKIQKILELLKIKSFEEVAKQYSEGPFRDKGGDLGFFKKDEMLKDLREVVSKMQPGEIKVVHSKAGIHIIKLIEIKSHKIPHESLYEKAERELKSKIINKKLEEWLKELKAKAVIIRKL